MELMMAQSVAFFGLLYILSIIFTISCSNWFLMWIGLEINMMSFIALVYDRSSNGVEVSMKYFFIQSLGSGILMLMFYSDSHWFEYVSMSVLSYKMGGGPFYFWFPSVCESMSWGSCLMLMTIQKMLPLMLISFLVSTFLWLIIISSILMGGLGSLNQNSMKRLMGYSSVHHIGWMLVGNFIADSMWIIYLLTYSMMILGIVLVLKSEKILDVGELKRMSSKWSFSLGMLSLGGMPPMLGFFLKWWLFYNLMMIDASILIFMLLMSVLMFYVYLRIVYNVIMGSSKVKGWSILESKKLMSGDLIYILGLNSGIVVWMIL